MSGTFKLMQDHYHLLESLWPKKLGLTNFSTKKRLEVSVKHKTEEALDSVNLMQSPDMVSCMEGWANNYHLFAAYLLCCWIHILEVLVGMDLLPPKQNHS